MHTTHLSLASINHILDLLVVFLPMPVVWNLQMAFSKNIAISTVFRLGAAYANFSLSPIVNSVIGTLLTSVTVSVALPQFA